MESHAHGTMWPRSPVHWGTPQTKVKPLANYNSLLVCHIIVVVHTFACNILCASCTFDLLHAPCTTRTTLLLDPHKTLKAQPSATVSGRAMCEELFQVMHAQLNNCGFQMPKIREALRTTGVLGMRNGVVGLRRVCAAQGTGPRAGRWIWSVQ